MAEERYRIDILSALVLCWTNTSQASKGDREGLEAVKRELKVAGRLLLKAVEGNEVAIADLRKEFEKLLEVDSGLGELFGVGGGEG